MSIGAILNIVPAMVFVWIVVLINATQTPREEGLILIGIKLGVNLNAFFHCCSILHQLLLLAYQSMLCNFPQWEATIIDKQVVPIASVIGTVIIAAFLVPALYCDDFLPQALKFYMSLSLTLSLGLCVGMLFQNEEEGAFFPFLVLCIFFFAYFTPALTFFDESLVLSQPIYLAVTLMCRTIQIIVSPLIQIFLVSELRDAVFENAGMLLS